MRVNLCIRRNVYSSGSALLDCSLAGLPAIKSKVGETISGMLGLLGNH